MAWAQADKQSNVTHCCIVLYTVHTAYHTKTYFNNIYKSLHMSIWVYNVQTNSPISQAVHCIVYVYIVQETYLNSSYKSLHTMQSCIVILWAQADKQSNVTHFCIVHAYIVQETYLNSSYKSSYDLQHYNRSSCRQTVQCHTLLCCTRVYIVYTIYMLTVYTLCILMYAQIFLKINNNTIQQFWAQSDKQSNVTH